MRTRKEHTRKEIQSYKADVKNLLRFGSELDLMQYLREIEIFDEDPRFAKAVNAYRELKKGKL
jgi:hypothetical protein